MAVADLAVRISADLKDLEKAEQRIQTIGKNLTNVGKGMSAFVTAPFVAAGVAAFKFGADLEDAMGAADQIFGHQSQVMQKWANDLESYYGIAEAEALEYANMMGTMLINIGGLTEEQAAKQAQTLIELAGDLTAMYGGTTADAVRALTGALKGNNTMLDNYGMAVNDALIKQKAFNMGLYSGSGELSLAAKQAATLNLIMEQSGAAMGQAARESEGASGTLRFLTTELQNVAAEIGQVLIPIITPFIGMIGDLVAWFGKLSPATQKTVVVIGGLVAAVGPALIIVGKIITAMTTILPLIQKITILKKAWTVVQAALNIVLSANPIGLIIIAIAALIAIIILCIKYWDEIVAALEKAWNWIKETAAKVWGAIADFFVNLWETIKGAFLKALEWIKNLFLNYHPVGLVIKHWEKIKDFFIGLWDAIKNIFKNALEAVKNFFIEKFEKMRDGVLSIWNTITDGIKSFINTIIDGINYLIRALNKIPGVSIGEVGKLKLSTDIPGAAAGGYVTRPGTVLVGERGPELLHLPRGAAVQPLEGAGTYYINVTIPARDLEEMRTVQNFFGRIQREARMRGV